MLLPAVVVVMPTLLSNIAVAQATRTTADSVCWTAEAAGDDVGRASAVLRTAGGRVPVARLVRGNPYMVCTPYIMMNSLP